MQDEHYELISEFIQETQDLVEQLEPIIVKLSKCIRSVNCWEVLNCVNIRCPRYKKHFEIPCWMHTGYIDNAYRTCVQGTSEQSCLDCIAKELESGDNESINAVFRLFHSMKGNASALGLKNISSFSHSAENLFDNLRSGSIWMNAKLFDLLNKACEFTKYALAHLEENMDDDGLKDEVDVMSAALNNALEGMKEHIKGLKDQLHQKEGLNKGKKKKLTPGDLNVFVKAESDIINNFEKSLLNWTSNINDSQITIELFNYIHSLKGISDYLEYYDLRQLCEKMEVILDTVLLNIGLDNNTVAKMLLELVKVLKAGVASSKSSESEVGNIPNLKIYLNFLDELVPEYIDADIPVKAAPFLGNILLEQGLISGLEIETALEEQKRPIGEILVESGTVTIDQVDAALKVQKNLSEKPGTQIEKVKTPGAKVEKRRDIRIDLNKLDNLIACIGELVIAENDIASKRNLIDLSSEQIDSSFKQLEKVVRELEELSIVIRMIPVTKLFQRIKRLSKYLSVKSGKKFELELVGEECVLDKNVIEIMTDPLVHIIRNSVDHGMEAPEERKSLDKPETGVIRLTVKHVDDEAYIIIEDDGRGLDKEAIISKAIERGLITGDETDLSDSAVIDLIFCPGFSTAKQVTDISGRGVGMDVVKMNLEKVRGKIDISFKNGVGTKTTIKIPLVTSIIDGLIVRIGRSKYILPLLSINESINFNTNDIILTPEGDEIVRVREDLLPIVRLNGNGIAHNTVSDNLNKILIVLGNKNQKICLMTDEIIQQQKIVIKEMTDFVGKLKYISGCTILGDGEVCMILNPNGLIN